MNKMGGIIKVSYFNYILIFLIGYNVVVDISTVKNTINQHGKKINRHGKIINLHGKIINWHGKIINQHGKIINGHGNILRLPMSVCIH